VRNVGTKTQQEMKEVLYENTTRKLTNFKIISTGKSTCRSHDQGHTQGTAVALTYQAQDLE